MTAAVLLIFGLPLLLSIVLYNYLVRMKYRVRNAWSQIDVQLKRRHDLIPNLVETVKGYARHERETLEGVIRARSAAQHASGLRERAEAENSITGSLRTLLALVESYPVLKADRNFLNLQEELAHTENRIAFARQYYNDEVMRYNTSLQTIPTNIIASLFSFGSAGFFEIDDPRERSVPRVNLA